MFHTEAGSREQVIGEFAGRGLPAAEDLEIGLPVQPASSSSRQVAGVAWITVAPDEFSKERSRFPSTTSSRRRDNHPCPHDQRQEQLQDGDVERQGRDGEQPILVRRPGSRAIEQSRLTTSRWVISTPLGRPVEPEV